MHAFLQNAFLIECSFLGLKSLGFVRMCLQHKIRKNEEGQYNPNIQSFESPAITDFLDFWPPDIRFSLVSSRYHAMISIILSI